jgi:hypothetical protein
MGTFFRPNIKQFLLQLKPFKVRQIMVNGRVKIQSYLDLDTFWSSVL